MAKIILIIIFFASILTFAVDNSKKNVIKVEKNNFGNIEHQSIIFENKNKDLEIVINSNFFCEPQKEVKLGRFSLKPTKTILANINLLTQLANEKTDFLNEKPQGEKLRYIYNKNFITEKSLMAKTIEAIEIEICESITKFSNVDSANVSIKNNSLLIKHGKKTTNEKIEFGNNCKDHKKYISCDIKDFGRAYLIK